jgi:chitinase
MAMIRLRPLLAGLALGTALVFVPAGNALAAADSQAPTAPVSPAREERTSTLVDTEPPTTPGDLRVTGQSATGVWLSWSYSVDNDGGMSALDYLIDDGTLTRTVPVVNSTSITGLQTNRTHTFTIRARDRAGNLSGTTQVSAFIENTPPTAPTNLRQIGTADGQAVFGWDPSTDNSGRISHYIVQFHTGQVFTTDLSVRIADLIRDCFLPPDRDLVTFTVTAQDPSGNRSPSANITLPVV